ncbi:RidA family protein [Saccharopolyspora sp. 5N102]|uniref:RidA family protein n=1 Tax=Saccharopolyspora sp. 5N102 TaxID=3375155 RepID=UPI0037BC060A
MNEPVELRGAGWDSRLVASTGSDAMPFAPAVVASGRTVWLSGATAFPLLPGDPDHSRGDIAEQTRACLENLRKVLEAAGGTVTDIVKVTIFNTDMDRQAAVNEVYRDFFGAHRPARSHIGVQRLADAGLKIEIEAVAVID